MAKETSKKDFTFIFLIFLAVCLFFWKIIIHPSHLIYSIDMLKYSYPLKFFTQTILNQDKLPLWIPHLFGGSPFLANVQTAVFYPFNVLFSSFLPMNLAFNYGFMFHFFLGGVFTYLLMRHFKAGRIASLVSSLIFSFSGFFVSHTFAGHDSMISTGIWIPLIFLFFDIALKKSSFFHILLAGFFIGVQFLAGHTQISFYTIFSLFLYALFNSCIHVKEKIKSSGKITSFEGFRKIITPFVILAFSVIFGVILSAIQLVPSFELSKEITRAGGTDYQFSSSYSLPLQNIITFVLPNFFGNPARDTYWGAWEYWELSGYFGVIPLILALFSLFFCIRDRKVMFFAVLSLLSLLLAFGRNLPFYWIFWKFFPGFSMFRVPARFLLIFIFSVSLLAGFGLDFLRRKIPPEKTKVITKILFYGAGAVFFGVVAGVGLKGRIMGVGERILTAKYNAINPPYSLEHYLGKISGIYEGMMREMVVLLVLLVVVGAVLWWRGRKAESFRGFGVLMAILVFANLCIAHNGMIVTRGMEEVYDKPSYVSFIKSNIGEYRIYDPDELIPSNYQIIFGINSLSAYTPIKLQGYTEIMKKFKGVYDKQDCLLLGMMNVKYILSPEPIQSKELKLIYSEIKIPNNYKEISFNKNDTYEALIYENLDVFSKAFFVREKDKEAIEKIPVKVVEYLPEKIVVEVETKKSGYVVISEMDYPGWKAYVKNVRENVGVVDGVKEKIGMMGMVNDTRGEGGVVDRVEMVGVMDGGEVEVEKALGGLRAVKIENPGKYEIVLRYEPLSVKIGAVMSLTGFLVFIVVLLINRKNFKKGLQR